MPNPLDALRKAQSISPDPRGVDPSQISRGEMVVGPGSFSGALAGLRGLFRRPAPIQQAVAQIEPLSAGSVQMMERMYQQANPVFKRLQDAGAFGGDRTVGSWPQVAPGASKNIQGASETLGEIDPRYTPVGGEEIYNIGRRAIRGLADPTVEAYTRIMSMMGR